MSGRRWRGGRAGLALLLAGVVGCEPQGVTEEADEGPPVAAACDVGTEGLCFDCHLCPEEGIPTIDVTHGVCVDCHSGPGGSVPPEVTGSCGCTTLDCGTEPPTLDCAVCHTPSSPVYPSREAMNGRCTACHAGDAGE